MRCQFMWLVVLSALGPAIITLSICPSSQAAAAEPETKPAAALEAAKAALEKAKSVAISRLESTAEYNAAAADVDAKEKALANARESGTPQERLDASSAYNRARATLAKLKADAMIADKELTAAQRNYDMAVRDEAAAAKEESDRQKAAADAEDAKKEPIRKAIKEARIIKGMTVEEGRLALTPPNTFNKTEESITNFDSGKKEVNWDTYVGGIGIRPILHRSILAKVGADGLIYEIVETKYKLPGE